MDTPPPNQCYRPEDRLRSKAEFAHVMERRCNARGKYILVYAITNEVGRARLGRIVSKRWGNAVARNRLRRWMREAFRTQKQSLPALDIVIIPVQIQGLSFAALQTEFLQLVQKVQRKLGS